MKLYNDAPSNFLKDSNASLKMKTAKKGVRILFFAYSISGVRGACWSSKIRTRTSGK
jgi:hypothetical protein